MFMEPQKIAQIANSENVKKASVSGRLLEEGWFDAANVEIHGYCAGAVARVPNKRCRPMWNLGILAA